ncbi:DUF2867 domain-containing protein [Kitasatospora sp. RG8]|uniref:DUF2867 domain-containing protein n=1 Tax=Kitasatospora sp. RG8 TaxID=2820815 RepID=UPI001AE03989|nr:DUF2867 domain-containing protein [Kitasatospora sp. RG8]MBP0452210.1 DUF2867 domain-containing protein [Kitasatospora sp. RG8]
MARRFAVRTDTEPVSAAMVRLLGGCHHIHALAVDVHPGTTAVDFTSALLHPLPLWIRLLLRLMDPLRACLGLPGSQVKPVQVTDGARIGPLFILDARDSQVLAGEDSRDLSCRTVFTVRPGAGGTEGVCTTVIRCYRPAGELYVRITKPLHTLILVSLARQLARAHSVRR